MTAMLRRGATLCRRARHYLTGDNALRRAAESLSRVGRNEGTESFLDAAIYGTAYCCSAMAEPVCVLARCISYSSIQSNIKSIDLFDLLNYRLLHVVKTWPILCYINSHIEILVSQICLLAQRFYK